MNTYQINSIRLGCDLQFKFNEAGLLMGFEVMQTIDVEKLKHLLQNILINKHIFIDTCKKNKVAVIEIMPDLSFETFWNKYNYKDGGSKKKAEALWERMSERNKSGALAYIKVYNDILIKQNVSKMYATTYLNEMRWLNK